MRLLGPPWLMLFSYSFPMGRAWDASTRCAFHAPMILVLCGTQLKKPTIRGSFIYNARSFLKWNTSVHNLYLLTGDICSLNMPARRENMAANWLTSSASNSGGWCSEPLGTAGAVGLLIQSFNDLVHGRNIYILKLLINIPFTCFYLKIGVSCIVCSIIRLFDSFGVIMNHIGLYR